MHLILRGCRHAVRCLMYCSLVDMFEVNSQQEALVSYAYVCEASGDRGFGSLSLSALVGNYRE